MRPLFDEDGSEPASEVSRDYVFELEHESGAAALLNVFGGKITTYRRLSEHALQKLKPFFPAAKGDWTARAKLPGGDIPGMDFEGLYEVKRCQSATGTITQTGQHDRRAYWRRRSARAAGVTDCLFRLALLRRGFSFTAGRLRRP